MLVINYVTTLLFYDNVYYTYIYYKIVHKVHIKLKNKS